MILVLLFVFAGTAGADIADFEDLSLEPESYWNGSDESGGFASGSMYFSNNYDTTYDSWDGFAYSNITDTASSGWSAQYNAITGAGQGDSANYGIGYVGWAELPAITLNTTDVVDGLYVRTTTMRITRCWKEMLLPKNSAATAETMRTGFC